MLRLCLLLSIFTLFGCGGASPEAQTADDAAEESATGDEVASEGGGEGELSFTERPLYQVAIQAELIEKYKEMGLPDELVQNLAVAQIEFNIPGQFKGVAFEANPIWQWDYALVSNTGKTEIRFKVVPGELTVPEGLPEGEVATPQKILSMELMNILMRLNGANLVADMQQHPEAEARTRFSADNYVTATFAPIPEFAKYEIGSAGIFYREGLGKIVVISLLSAMDDPDARIEWTTGAGAMRFTEQTEAQ